jgi:hypothetical protein
MSLSVSDSVAGFEPDIMFLACFKSFIACLSFELETKLSDSSVLVEWHSTLMHFFESDTMFLACFKSFIACLSLSNSKQNCLTSVFFVVSLFDAYRINVYKRRSLSTFSLHHTLQNTTHANQTKSHITHHSSLHWHSI